EAVIGYLSAAIEWAQRQGDEDAWRLWWEDPAAKSFYFIGKDNITFHTIIWPGLLMAYGGLDPPFDVPANQYVHIAGAKTSARTRPHLGRLDPGLSRPLRPRPASLLPRGHDAGDAGLGVLVGRVRPSQQRRAGRHLGQPRQPRAYLHLPQLRGPHPGAGRADR